MAQTRKTGSTISCLRPARPDRARMPVMLPRQSDSDMRRDGSNAADMQPDQPVDERGRVHGVPDLDDLAKPRGVAWNSVGFTVECGERRWRRLAKKRTQIRGQDKRRRGAKPSCPGCSLDFQGFGTSLRDVRENRAMCGKRTDSAKRRVWRTSHGFVP